MHLKIINPSKDVEKVLEFLKTQISTPIQWEVILIKKMKNLPKFTENKKAFYLLCSQKSSLDFITEPYNQLNDEEIKKSLIIAPRKLFKDIDLFLKNKTSPLFVIDNDQVNFLLPLGLSQFIEKFNLERIGDEREKYLQIIENKVINLSFQVESELARLKILHEKLVPKRHLNFHGLNLWSKFFPGDKKGSDFVDTFKIQQNLTITLSSTNSRDMNINFLDHYFHLRSYLQSSPSIDDFNQIYQQILSKNVMADDFSLTMSMIDIRSLIWQGINYGQNVLLEFSADHSKILPLAQQFQIQLERGKNYLLLTHGFTKNWSGKEVDRLRKIQQFLKKHGKKNIFDLLDELFFKIKMGREDYFLSYDATAFLIEVATNVLHTV